MTESDFEQFYTTVSRAVRVVVRAEQRRTSTAAAHRHAKAQVRAALLRACPSASGMVGVDGEASKPYNVSEGNAASSKNLIGAQ